MKTSLLATAIALILTASSAAPAAQSALAQLGLEESEAKDSLLSALNYGAVHIGSGAARVFKAAPVATQKAIVDGIVAWAKRHTASAEFTRAYAASRDVNKPDAPAAAEPVDEELEKQAEEQRKAIEQMKKVAASLPADQRKAMEEGIKEAIAAMQAVQNDPAMRKMQEDGAEAARKDAQEQHQRDVAKWKEDFPENPNVLIARRLRAFLDASADVDFSAKLVASGDKMKFADAKYEQKPSEWKMCYRAGRDAVAAARAVAAAWLKEISS